MDNTETINVLSLCTGYGGLEIGLARALEGVFRVVAVEVEAFALANLAAKAKEGRLAVDAMWPDLKTFPAERFRGCFDFILAGYPCQPWSVAGKRRGGTDERHLWPIICRIIEAVRPVYICIENVPGLLSGRILDNRPDIVEYLTALVAEERKAGARGRWYIGEHRRRLTARLLQQEGIQAYAGVYLDLQDLAYQIEPGLFTSAEVGAPHKRQRLFILAYNSREGLSQSRLNWKRKSQTEKGKGVDRRFEQRSGQLADAERGVQQGCPTRQRQVQSGRSCLWPARPGQPQYEWEEPRVVGDTSGGISRSRGTGNSGQSIDEGFRNRNEQAQSRLGGAVDGPSCRLDRLRLLGNGVVPQQAEKAFRELIKLCSRE